MVPAVAAAVAVLLFVVFADINTFVTNCEQYGIKKRESDANVSSLAARDDGGRKKLSSAGLPGDVQANQGAVRTLHC